MEKFNIDYKKIRLENESLKEDIVMFEKTINSIRERLKIMLRVGEFRRTEEEKIFEEIFSEINPYIHKYIENLKCVTKVCDKSLSLIETPDELIASPLSLWE